MRRSQTHIAAALVLAACVAHAPALTAVFQFDDYAVIVDNPSVHSLAAWWASMPGIRPLLKLSYALNHALWPGTSGFHAANMLVHVTNTLLVWRLSRHWLPHLGLPAASAAPLAALLFAVHPATTETVAYASGRSISLAALFMLAAWLADARHVASRPASWSIASPLLFAVALGVRETSLVVPLAFVLLALCAPTHSSAGERLRRYAGHALVVLIGTGCFVIVPGYVRFFATSLATRDAADQLAGQLGAQAYLATRPLLGAHTNIDPPAQAILDSAPPMFVAVLLAVLAIAAWRLRRRVPWAAFAIGWYVLMLAPSNSLLPRLDLANDRHLYLALLGPAWIVAGTLARLPSRRLASVLGVALAGALGIATWQRSLDYRSESALWMASVAAAPANARAWTNLGYAWRRLGDRERAHDAYLCALAFDRRNEQAILNLDALGKPAVARPRSPRACAPEAFAAP
ncbi:MAG: hypothetical protein J0L88_02565 [Xanthomonadales bacterium]|nr:hypothetical protein [Xanthomonadales bacterium]